MRGLEGRQSDNGAWSDAPAKDGAVATLEGPDPVRGHAQTKGFKKGMVCVWFFMGLRVRVMGEMCIFWGAVA